MAKVDSKGRIVLPKKIRERLGLTPGSDVEVREADGKAVVEPETDPDRILDRMDRLVAETAGVGEATTPFDGVSDPVARKHRDAVRRGADGDADE